MELFKAHRQWAKRPDDERFQSIQALYDACKTYAQTAREKEVPFADLRLEALDGDVQLVGKAGVPARFTHWAFGQACARLGAPANYLRDLPATLAVQNLNHGLARLKSGLGNVVEAARDAASGRVAQLLFHQNGGLLLRALTSDRYARIWNWEVAERLLDLESKGWEPARPDFNAIGDGKDTALYASDHDMFAFLRTKNAAIDQPVNPGRNAPIYRGIIVENSEVGASAAKVTRFLYNCMCGNHIIWGASEVVELSVRHVGDARGRWGAFAAQVKKWADASVSEEEGVIESARHRVIAATKEEVLDAIFGKRGIGLTRKAIEGGYQAVVEAEDGPANTVWGMVQGLTRYSQSLPYADARVEVDRKAGRLLEAEF